MLRLLRAYFRGEYRNVSQDALLTILAAVSYLVDPFDLIPDEIPFLGLLDDHTVIGFAVTIFPRMDSLARTSDAIRFISSAVGDGCYNRTFLSFRTQRSGFFLPFAKRTPGRAVAGSWQYPNHTSLHPIAYYSFLSAGISQFGRYLNTAAVRSSCCGRPRE